MLRKILFFLWTIFLFIPVFLSSVSSANAADLTTCTASATKSTELPAPAPDDTTKQITIYVSINASAGVADGGNIQLLIKPHGESTYYTIMDSAGDGLPIPYFFNIVDGKLTADKIGRGEAYYVKGGNNLTFKPGKYDLKVVPRGASIDNSYCTMTNAFEVTTTDTGPDNYCVIKLTEEFADNDYTFPNTTVRFRVKKFTPVGDLGSVHRVITTGSNGYKEPHNDQRYTTSFLLNEGVTLPEQLSVGTYRIQVWEKMNPGEVDEGKSCFSNYFKIGTEENPGHECTTDNSDDCNIVESNKPLSLPCDNTEGPNYNSKVGCLRVKTAIGYVNTQANDFVKWVLGFVLGISGGIVLIIIIISGYRLMTSQGDPEKVKNARDQLTAAVVGLLFIIFSLVILQLITHDILQLPASGSKAISQ